MVELVPYVLNRPRKEFEASTLRGGHAATHHIKGYTFLPSSARTICHGQGEIFIHNLIIQVIQKPPPLSPSDLIL